MKKIIIVSLIVICGFQIKSQTVPTASFTTDNAKCVGIPVIFVDQSTNTSTSWTWTCTAGTPSLSTAQNPSITYTAAGIYTVNLSVASGTVVSSVYTKTVVVSANPIVSITAPTVCSGYSVTLIANGAATYTWLPGALSGASYTTIANSTTNYAVTGTSAQGCKNTTSVLLTTLPTPTIMVNSPTICAGSAVALNAAGGSSYSWNNGAIGATISVNPTITTNYTVFSIGANGCKGEAISTVTVNALPFVAATSTIICYAETATLTASGANTYSWNNGTTGAVFIDNPLISTTYSVTGTSIIGCSKTVTANIIVGSAPTISVNSPTICLGSVAHLIASGVNSYTWSTNANTQSINTTPIATTIYTVSGVLTGCNGIVSKTATVTVNPLPTVTTTSASICAGFQTTVTASGASIYQWLPGSLVGANHIVAPSVNTTYTVIGTSAVGCKGTNTTNVVVYTAPSVTAVASLYQYCMGTNTVTLIANGATTYTWSTMQQSYSILVSPTATQAYTVIGKNSNGCADTASLTITVHPLPNVSLGALASPVCMSVIETPLIGIPSSGIYSGPGVAGSGYYSSTSGSGTFTLTYQYTDMHNCTASASQTILVNPCTDDIKEINSELYALYPNPATDNIYIKNNAQKTLDVAIYNSIGELIMREVSREPVVNLFIESLASGVYCIKISTPNEIFKSINLIKL